MDKKEQEFLAKLLATFKVEADEHLKNLNDTLLKLETGVNENEKKKSCSILSFARLIV